MDRYRPGDRPRGMKRGPESGERLEGIDRERKKERERERERKRERETHNPRDQGDGKRTQRLERDQAR